MSKDFSDFIHFLTVDKIEAIAEKANDTVQSNREDLTDNPQTALGNQVGILSYNIALGLIEEYHSWSNA